MKNDLELRAQKRLGGAVVQRGLLDELIKEIAEGISTSAARRRASLIPTEPRGRGSNRDLSNFGRLADIRAKS